MKIRTTLQAGCNCADNCTHCKTPAELSFCANNCIKTPERKWCTFDGITSDNKAPSVHWKYGEQE